MLLILIFKLNFHICGLGKLPFVIVIYPNIQWHIFLVYLNETFFFLARIWMSTERKANLYIHIYVHFISNHDMIK